MRYDEAALFTPTSTRTLFTPTSTRTLFTPTSTRTCTLQWEWVIVVDEHTDESGWQYGGCGFRELLKQRLPVRSRAGTYDLVKRRTWVHRNLVNEIDSKKVNIISPSHFNLVSQPVQRSDNIEAD